MLILSYCSYAVICILALWQVIRWADKNHPALRERRPQGTTAGETGRIPERELPGS